MARSVHSPSTKKTEKKGKAESQDKTLTKESAAGSNSGQVQLYAAEAGEGRPLRQVALNFDYEKRVYRVATCGSAVDLSRLEHTLAITKERIPYFQYRRCSVEDLALSKQRRIGQLRRAGSRRQAELEVLFSALRERQLDLLVLPAEDLLTGLDPDLELAAVLPRKDARDVLVLRQEQDFAHLRPGARIAVSSRRQEVQLFALRQGVVAQRVEQPLLATLQAVHNQEVEGAIVKASDLLYTDLESYRSKLQFRPFRIDTLTPAPGAGFTVLLARRKDEELLKLFHKQMNHKISAQLLEVEQLAGQQLGFASIGVDPPAAAYAQAVGDGIELYAMHTGSEQGRPQRVVQVVAKLDEACQAETIRAAIQRLLGRVAFVGAGPGHPDLVSYRAVKLLKQADVVLYDPETLPCLLAYANGQARRYPVVSSSQKNKAEVWGQETDSISTGVELVERLIQEARAGHQVIRLVQGDPFFYDEAAEELQSLEAAGLPFEVVPGVPAGLAAASYAGLPLGSLESQGEVHILDAAAPLREISPETCYRRWAELPGVLVIIDAAEHLGDLVAGLMTAGKAGRSQVTLIQAASTTRQSILRCTLAEVVRLAQQQQITAPATLVLGATREGAERLHWWPGCGLLAGQSVALLGVRSHLSREGEGAGRASGTGLAESRQAQPWSDARVLSRRGEGDPEDALTDLLQMQGATVYSLELLAVSSQQSQEIHLDDILSRYLGREREGGRRQEKGQAWLVFYQPQAVDAMVLSIKRQGLDLRRLSRCHLAAANQEVMERLRSWGLNADFGGGGRSLEQFCEQLTARLRKEDQVLALRGPLVEPILPVLLQLAGIAYEEVLAYELYSLEQNQQILLQQLSDLDALIFKDAASVWAFVEAAASAGYRASELRRMGLTCYAMTDSCYEACLQSELPMVGRPGAWSAQAVVRQLGQQAAKN